MKNVLLLACMFCAMHSYAQVSISNNKSTTPNASAMLDVISTEKGILIPRMSSTQRNDIQNPANGLMVYDTTTNGFWYFNGTAWINISNTDNQSISRSGLTVTLENGGSFTDSVDNMGNHIATENIQLNGNWMSNDGGDEGISILDNGRVGVGTDSAHTAFHVGSSNTLNDVPSVYALFGPTEGSGILDGKIELRSNRTGVSNGEGGVVLTNFDNDISATKVMGDLAMMGEDNTENLGGIRLRTSADGTYANMTNALEVDKNQNINIPNGALTVGEYTLPTTDGIENQVLATDGEGNLSWEAAASMSNITLNYSFEPATRTNIYENYLGTFSCTGGKISVELIDAGNGHGSSNYYDITVDFGSTPVVTFHHDALAGNGYIIHYRQISGCNYEFFFEPETGTSSTISYRANIKTTGTVDTALSASNDTDILPCNTGVTVDRLGHVGISNTNPTEELDVTGDAAISGTLKVGAYTLPSTDGTADQILKTSGNGNLSWIDNDLLNHNATQNIALNGNWISNGGGSNGIKIQTNNGYVGINTDSALAALHVQGAATSSGVPHIQAIFGSTQGSGLDGKIEVRSVRGSVTSSTGGVVLTNYDIQIDSTSVMGDMSILGTDNTNNLGGIRFRTTADGTYANMTSALEIDKDQNINIPNGTLTVNGYTLPSADGNSGEILVTDGSGGASWANANESIPVPDTTEAIPIRYHGDYIYVYPTDNGTSLDWTTAQTTCSSLTALGFSDWYLPSRLELDAIYKQSYLITGLSQTESAKYWSNTAFDTENAYTQRLDYGGPDPDPKTETSGHNCRCIRKK